MQDALRTSDAGEAGGAHALEPPAITLPKGGGAVRGIGEKFAANPVTGTGSMSVPIATSPGRSGFGPQLSLSYDSGAGNGPFGFGWSLGLPSITRKTDKGLPRYLDAGEPDVFILSGAEDLVPVYRQDPDGSWVREPSGSMVIHEYELGGYRIRRYRPRIEGLFARIERWSKVGDAGDVHWRTISRDNVFTLYGLDTNSRIADPLDPGRIFSWLICETRDDKGNGVLYHYRAEDGLGLDVESAHERNRGPESDVRRTANRYLKCIHYGNRTPLLDDAGQRPRFLDKRQIDDQIANADWMFEVVFDYGDHDPTLPTPSDDQARDAAGAPKYPWRTRPDPFSSYRPGFELRTSRVCRRVLMFHHFPGEPGVERDCLVRSTDFTYSDDVDPTDVRNPVYAFLRAVTQSGYRRNNAGYDSRSLPPVEFEYTEPVVQDTVEHVDPESLENMPIGLDGSLYRWTDLHGEGIPGILTEQASAWFYKRNWSPVPVQLPDGSEVVKARFSALETVAFQPSVALAGSAEFMDLAGDGQPDVVVMDGPTPGLFEHDEAEGWQPFRPFTSRLNRDLRDPNLKFVDLDGDGHADVLVTEDDAFIWHASLAEDGFGATRRVAQAPDEEEGPRIVFADGTQSIYLADLSGDGLTDIVRIRNGEVCYWPSLGYGHFGAKVTMDNSPWFDDLDQFDSTRIRLADIDGSGTTDIIYLHRDGVRLYFNQSGNSWSRPQTLRAFPAIDNLASIVPIDLLGNGTACLVWSSPLPDDARRPMRYVNLMGEHKPHLLAKVKNNLGMTTDVRYAPSTKFYLQDKRDGKPWITRLAFPVHVVERVSVTDKWRGTTFSTTYSYHHGYFDGTEREFRGFGRVEQIDTEDYGKFSAGNAGSPYVTPDHKLYQPPVKTVTWLHTGAFTDQARVLSLYADEYFPNWFKALSPQTTDVLGGFEEKALADPDFARLDLTPEEWREALRACKGMPLRQEIYELDVDALRAGVHMPVKLFSTACHNCHVERLQPRETNRHAVFMATESEALTYHYELDLRGATHLKPDPRVSHTLNLRVDEFGHVLQSVAVGYPRFLPFDDPDAALSPQTVSLIRKVQAELHVAYTETRYTGKLEDSDTAADNYRLPLPCEIQTYELTGIPPGDDGVPSAADPQDRRYFDLDQLRAYLLSEHYQTAGKPVGLLQYHEQPDSASPSPPAQKRLVEHVCTLYFDDVAGTAPTQPLPFGRHGPRGLKYEDYKLALTEALLTAVFGTKLSEPMVGGTAREKLDSFATSGYLSGPDLADRFKSIETTGQYWIRSGVAGFAADAAKRFFLPRSYEDSFGNVTEISFDPHDLYIQSSKDARGNATRLLAFDFRVLAPSAMQDPNGNVTGVAFDLLGMPVAVAWESGGDALPLLNSTHDPLALTHFMEMDEYDDSEPRRWLGNATSRFLYHLGEVMDAAGHVIAWEGRPAGSCAIRRETHVTRVGGHNTKFQVSIVYSDGSGNVLVRKRKAEPDPQSRVPQPPLRWIVDGKTVLNNKGKPVKRFEPYFSDTQHRFDVTESERDVGVTRVMRYDAPGRLIRTDTADGTFTLVEFSPWHVKTFDANDTTRASRWYRERLTAVERGTQSADVDPSEEAKARTAPPDDKRAARQAALHADTPAETLLDSLGREVIVIVHNREPSQDPTQTNIPLTARPWLDRRDTTFTKLDPEGKPLWVRDARGNLVMQYIMPFKANDDVSDDAPSVADGTGKRIPSVPCYDIAGNLLFQHSMDAGDRWALVDAAGKPFVAWDLNDRGPHSTPQTRIFCTDYDALHRPTKHWLKIDTGAAALVEVFEYCDTDRPTGAADLADARARNLIGQAVRCWDSSGLSTVERVDLSGKPAHVTRSLITPEADAGTDVVNWNVPDPASLLEPETFLHFTDYDALGRPTRLYNWHRDITFGANGVARATPGASNRVAVYEPAYNERGALVAEWFHARATKMTDPAGRVTFSRDAQRSVQAITRITYNAKGQKLSRDLGNGTTTRYTYDPATFRLVHLYTRRAGAVSAGDCGSNTPEAPRPERPCGMQNLHYTYDPVGNLTHIQDDAQQSRFFANARVEPSADYTYDALYRLIEATGRENAAALGVPQSRDRPWPANGFPSPDALSNYTQRYVYDAVGNFAEMTHLSSNGPGWTRHYTPAEYSNRLERTWYGGDTLTATVYRHDAHGNILNVNRTATPPPLSPSDEWGLDIRWDWRDMILGFDLGGGGTARYCYDTSRQRTRKHITRLGNVVEDRIDLGGYELYRRFPASGNMPVEEIESHHLFHSEERLLLVDDVIQAAGPGNPRPDGSPVKAQTLFRYQYNSHLGSACLELDGNAAIISYEEFHPYGTSAYRLMASRVEAPPKRYRYTGMERDEESGLSYHAARYYMPGPARWASPDPTGIQAGLNAYVYAGAAPVSFVDRTGQQKTSEADHLTQVATFFYNQGWMEEYREYHERARQARRDEALALARDVRDQGSHIANVLLVAELSPLLVIALQGVVASELLMVASRLVTTPTVMNLIRSALIGLRLSLAPVTAPAVTATTTISGGVVLAGGATTTLAATPAVVLPAAAATSTALATTAQAGLATMAVTGITAVAVAGNPDPLGLNQTAHPPAGGTAASVETPQPGLTPTQLDVVTGLPLQIHFPAGTVIGPAFATAEAAQAAGEHVLEVTLSNAEGTVIGHWFEASEPGSEFYGHTEQKALLRVNLSEGMSLRFKGDYPPCSYDTKAACFQAMDTIARLLNVDITYESPYGVLEFHAGEGHKPNEGGVWTPPTK
jgi:RHS repeat-associated protein